ncbi:MAG: choice-of-anchor D domain-containing protein, partial [Actinobacteria bacterium]|nr:choice-of-anchor D domain-containing protein [Actinomycetota bacterium]
CFTIEPLAPGASCTSGVRFRPQAEGAHTGGIAWSFTREGDGATLTVGTDLAGVGVSQLAISATAVDFGSVAETGEATRSITITNRGSVPVVLGSRATTNATNFSAVDDACFTPDPLAPGASCTSGIRFRPQAQGPLTGRISWHFTRDGDNSGISVGTDLAGTGTPQLAISAAAIPFGNMVVGGTITEAVTITNRGGTDVVLGSRSTNNATHFGAVNDACFTVEPLGPGESCTVDVRFRPQAEGTHTGRIAWHYTRQPNGPSLSVGVDLSGIGSAQLGMAVSAVDFGDVPVTASAVRPLSITNHGDTAVVLNSRSTSNATHFNAVDDACFTVDPLEPGETCTVGVRFRPQAEGAHSGQVAWHFSRPSDGGFLSIAVDLRGNGVAQLVISQAAIDFGNVVVGQSELVSVTLTNRGGVPLTLSSRSTSNAGNFAAVDDGCFTIEPLAPGASCTSSVRFRPQTTGPLTGQVGWHFTRQGTSTVVSTAVDLSGTGI